MDTDLISNTNEEQRAVPKAAPVGFLKKVRGFLNEDICSNKQNFRILFIFSCILVVLEFGAYMAPGGILSIIASRIWMAGWIICIIGIIYFFIIVCKEEIRERNLFFFVGIISIIIILFSTFGDLSKTVIGQDATQQLAAGLRSFYVSDWNYTGTAFLDYPNRQYVLAALPALILDRTIIALKLGFAYPFYLGLMMFIVGMHTCAKKLELQTNLAIISTLSLFAFPYIIEYYIYFEHTLFPVCFSLMAFGWLVFFINKPTILNVFGLMWTAGMLATCYTTALAALGLLLVILFLIGISTRFSLNQFGLQHLQINKIDRCLGLKLCLMIMTIPMVYAFLSLITRPNAESTFDPSRGGIFASMAVMSYGYRIFFLNDYAIFTGIFAFFIIVYMIYALIGKLGIVHLITAVWILAVVGLTHFLMGFGVYRSQINMSRALVTIPVIVVAVSLVIFRYLKEKNIKVNILLLLVLLCITAGHGLYYISKPIAQGDAEMYFTLPSALGHRMLIADMEAVSREFGFNHTDDLTIVLDINDLYNFYDYSQYTFPNANLIILRYYNAFPHGYIDFSKGAIIYTINNIQFGEDLIVDNTYVYLGSYPNIVRFERIIVPPF